MVFIYQKFKPTLIFDNYFSFKEFKNFGEKSLKIYIAKYESKSKFLKAESKNIMY